jgi:hypothetical protein
MSILQRSMVSSEKFSNHRLQGDRDGISFLGLFDPLRRSEHDSMLTGKRFPLNIRKICQALARDGSTARVGEHGERTVSIERKIFPGDHRDICGQSAAPLQWMIEQAKKYGVFVAGS